MFFLLGWYNLGDDGTFLEGYFPHYNFTIEKIYAIHENYAVYNYGNYGEKKARGIFLYTLAGVVARNAVENGSGVLIYVSGTQSRDKYLEYIASCGIPVDYTYDVDDPDSLWNLAAAVRSYTSGYYLKCNMSNASVNWATSLAGKYRAPVVDGSITSQVEAAGYTLLKSFDAAGGADYTDENTVYSEYKTWVGNIFILGDILDYLDSEDYTSTTNSPKQAFFLPRDFIIFAKGWAFYDDDMGAPRTTYLSDAVDDSPIMGWMFEDHAGNSVAEDAHVGEATERSIVSVPSDFVANLPATLSVRPELYNMRLKKRVMVRDLEYPDTATKKYVVIQLSDGDNLVFSTQAVPFDANMWGSNIRGSFPFSWSVPALAFEAIPQSLQYFASTQRFNDTFTLPVSGGGYFYYNQYPDPPGLTTHYQRINEFMKKMGITSTVIMVNDGVGGLPADFNPAVYNLDKGLGGFVYSYGSGYNAFSGAVRWGTTHNGRDLPFISCRERVWDGLETETDVINNVNSASAGSFILVVLHAWSVISHAGGVMGTAQRLVEGFNSDVKVCGTDEFLLLYRMANKPDQVVGEFLSKIRDGLNNLTSKEAPTDAARKYLEDAQSNYTVAQNYYSTGNYQQAFNYARVADRNLAHARVSYATLEVDLSDNRTVYLKNLAPANPSIYFHSITEIDPSHPDYEVVYWQASLDENFSQIVYDLYMDWKMGGKNPKFTFPVRDGQKWYVRAKVREVAELEGSDSPLWGEWSNVVVLDRSMYVSSEEGEETSLSEGGGYRSGYVAPSVSVSVYPNPAASGGKVKFKISSNFIYTRVRVVVRNIMGFPVLNAEYKASETSSLEFPLLDYNNKPLKRGLYIVQVILEDDFGAQVSSSMLKVLVK